MPRGSRNAISFPSERATTENAPSSLRIVFATASASGAGSFAIMAAMTSVSAVVFGRWPSSAELLAELRGVREVAVVAERHRPGGAVLDERLSIRPVRRARGRVARVADRELAGQSTQLLLVEDLGHEAHVAKGRQVAAVRHRDAGRLLAAVLEREEPEVREPRDVALG